MRQIEYDVYVSAEGIELRVDDPEHDDLVTLLEKLRETQLLGVVVGYSRGHGPDMTATVTGFEQREFAQSAAASIFGNALVQLGFADGWQFFTLQPRHAILTVS